VDSFFLYLYNYDKYLHYLIVRIKDIWIKLSNVTVAKVTENVT